MTLIDFDEKLNILEYYDNGAERLTPFEKFFDKAPPYTPY